jgi:6-pyruvoyltetrahydropterin/6-carboxytetrahydropterin synthase
VPIKVEIKKEFRFEAAHFLPRVPKEHQCHKLHGHSYKVVIAVIGPIDEHLGWVMDLNELSLAFAPLHKVLDHSLLNEVEGLSNPTSENVALWIFRNLEQELPGLSSVTLSATGRISVTINREQFC